MSFKGFNGRHTESLHIDPTAGGHAPRERHRKSVDAACDEFLRQREPGYAAAKAARAEQLRRNRDAGPNPHARG